MAGEDRHAARDRQPRRQAGVVLLLGDEVGSVTVLAGLEAPDGAEVVRSG